MAKVARKEKEVKAVVKGKKTKPEAVKQKKGKTEEKVTKTLTGKKIKKEKAISLDDMISGDDFDISKLKTIGQLREAKYNPRHITDSRLKDLGNSLASFGDLSGVVFNGSAKSGVLISGHQRIKSIKDWSTVIELKKTKDAHGTVGIGYIHATCPNTKKKISIPMRVVSWTDRKAEFAANIAANAHGGEFDNKKLAELVNKLDTSTIDPSIMGLDPLQLRGLQQRLGKAKTGDGMAAGQMNGSSGKFREITEEEMDEKLEHKCPRCNFQF